MLLSAALQSLHSLSGDHLPSRVASFPGLVCVASFPRGQHYNLYSNSRAELVMKVDRCYSIFLLRNRLIRVMQFNFIFVYL